MRREARQPDMSYRPNRDEGDFERIRIPGIVDPTVQFEGEQGRIMTTVENVGAGNFLVVLDTRLDPAEIDRERVHVDGIVQNLDLESFARDGSVLAIPNTPPEQPPAQPQPTLAVVQVAWMTLGKGDATDCTVFTTEERNGYIDLRKDRRVIVLGAGDRTDQFPALPKLGQKEVQWLKN